MTRPIEVVYNTSNSFKQREANLLFREFDLMGTPICNEFSLRFTTVPVKETLEVDLETMVTAEAVSAYNGLNVPCIVEHAGIIFEEFESASYPGGLTKPMWNALESRFLEETNSNGRAVIARAVVGYCDGQDVHTFIGETRGTLVQERSGGHEFYWDTVFVPEASNPAGKTYSEIVESEGLRAKLEVSQSTKALMSFLEYRRANLPKFWDITF